MKKLILLVGAKRQGKDHLANYLMDLMPENKEGKYMHSSSTNNIIKVYDSEKIKSKHAIAEPIYSMVADMLGITVKELEEDKEQYRHYLEFMGNDMPERLFGSKECWLNQCIESIEREDSDYSIITDMRTLEEYYYFCCKFCSTHDIHTVRVIREGFEDPSPSVHKTNIEWQDIPFNTEIKAKNLEELKIEAEKLYNKIA